MCICNSSSEVENDPEIKGLVNEQMRQWSEMMEKHRKEEWTLLKTHIKSQEDILKKLMENEQALNMKKLDTMHEQ